MFEEFAKKYIRDVSSALEKMDMNILEEIKKLVKKAIVNKSTIFLIGNGGSAATPSHSAGDFSKEIGARTICLTDNIASLTAWANDTDYSNVFLGPLEIYLDKNDLILGYSGSGNSKNVIEAMKFGRANGAKTVGITGNYLGKGAGKIKEVSDVCLVFETESMEIIEDLELIVNHIIKESIKSEF